MIGNLILYDVNEKQISSLTQWDYNVSIKVVGVKINPIPEVRCWNKISKVAKRVNATVFGEFLVFTVPNELLQDCFPINIQLFYCYESGDSKTEYRTIIPVMPGKKPDGYIYSPTEIVTLEALEERIKALENNKDDSENEGIIVDDNGYITTTLGGLEIYDGYIVL